MNNKIVNFTSDFTIVYIVTPNRMVGKNDVPFSYRFHFFQLKFKADKSLNNASDLMD